MSWVSVASESWIAELGLFYSSVSLIDSSQSFPSSPPLEVSIEPWLELAFFLGLKCYTFDCKSHSTNILFDHLKGINYLL